MVAMGLDAIVDGRPQGFADIPLLKTFAKRCFDIVFSLVGLIVLAPLMMATALSIKLSSSGCTVFRQDRYGWNGSPFRIYKFRTMYADRCDLSGTQQTSLHDSRVTPLGRLLRRRSVDELPQLFNVLKGDMSLVGPRAHAVDMTVAGIGYETLVENYHLRHRVRPGITGLAQVRGLRGPVLDIGHARARIEADMEYIAHHSLWMDVTILLRTVTMEITAGSGL